MIIKLKYNNLYFKYSPSKEVILFYSIWFYAGIVLGYFLSETFAQVIYNLYRNKILKLIQFRKKLHLKKLIQMIIAFCLKFIQNWFYASIVLNYFLSEIFAQVIYNFDRTKIPKLIQFRKKLHLKKLIQMILAFCLKFIQNWFQRILEKSSLVWTAIIQLIKAIQIFFKKFFKSPFKLKSNFRQFTSLLNVFMGMYQIVLSLINEIFFPLQIIRWLVEWRNLIKFLMKESQFRNSFFFFILLHLLGILIGFFIGLFRYKYKTDDEEISALYLFILLLLLNEFSPYKLYSRLYRTLFWKFYFLFREVKPVALLKDFLKPLPLMENCSPEFILKEPGKIPDIPIYGDPFLHIKIDIFPIFNDTFESKFELFHSYQNLNDKIKH